MMLLLHIGIALTSLVVTTVLYIAPSKGKLQAAYILAAGTLASGTYLVMATHTHILQACISGLVYLAAVSFGIVAARRKLAVAPDNTRS
jgi:hypothetical protein